MLFRSHPLLCPARIKQNESETVVEPIPEKPKLIRTVTAEPKHEKVEPEEVKPKVKKTENIKESQSSEGARS